MGAAGFVTVYKRSEVEQKWEEKFPDQDIEKAWWYLNTVTLSLDGQAYIFDYWDDQGYHDGTANDFWFESGEAQQQVQQVLKECKSEQVEVWT